MLSSGDGTVDRRRSARDGGELRAAVNAVLKAVAFLALGLLAAAPWAATRAPAPASKDAVSEVTRIAGPSWLRRLGLSVDETSMGHAGAWVSPPVDSSPPEWEEALGSPIEEVSVTLTGADLYRFSCQPCHKADGAGLPPIIPSLIGPVRAASPAGFRAQMKARRYEMDEATIRELTSQSETALRERLKRGGEKMPAFEHLGTVEVEALLAYLKLLAGVPGAESRPIRVTVPALRIGEQVVKGTCQICHDATGPGRDEAVEISMMRGVIPSLASLPEQRKRAEVIRKVRIGLAQPVVFMRHGRMPVLDYLSAEEVGAVYEYLSAYTPQR